MSTHQKELTRYEERKLTASWADPQYRRDYMRGRRASQRYTGYEVTPPLERADQRGETGAWYDGYTDYALD